MNTFFKAIKLPLVILLTLIFGTGCLGPAKIERFESIEPNETAFLVPLEGESLSGQAEFMSIGYLNESKIATKRISLPLRKHKTGRMWYKYEWIATMRVIKVNRRPVTREWTGKEDTGTAGRDEALWVESADSIGFGVGVNTTALITEKNAATFLYYFAGKSLAAVVDENVRGKINSVLSREFANYQLETARRMKNQVFEIAKEETVEEFAKMGVTITNLGLAEGLVYADGEIQQAINNAFKAEMSIQVKAQEKLAQDETNLKTIAMAKAAADAKVEEAKGMIAIEKAKAEAAQQFAKSLEARMAQVDLEIRRMDAEARLTFAKRIGPNVLPANILPAGSGMLFGLDSAR